MAGHAANHAPVDVFRKTTIVGLLFAALFGMYQSVEPGGHGVDTVLLAVGFVVLASYTIGELAEVLKLPHITGYLLAGLFLGGSAAHTLAEVQALQPWLLPPFDVGLLNHDVLDKLGPMDTLALALICLTAGGELKLEDLRSGFGRIAAILGVQTVTIMGGIIGFTWLISGPIPFLTFEPLAGLSLTSVLAIGAVLASVSLATAPAATIAIINSTGAKGPMTGNVLPVVVLKDVIVVLAFSAATAIAVSTFPDAGVESSLLTTLAVIVMSLVLGAVVGGLIHLYLRYVGAEILLFIIGMVYATAEGAGFLTHLIDPHAHPELALVFIAAGFTTSNFSSMGDELIHEVERLSLPVYVVFFTMAGAKLHLEDLVSSGLFAGMLVAARILMLFIGVRLGAVISGADAMTQRYGWMGFISQAGLALTLAGSVQATFGKGVGDGMFSLILAGVALNEILGPVLLQLGLQFAGETAAQRQGDDGPTEAPTEEVDHVQRTPEEAASWGEPIPTGNPQLDALTENLEADLRQLVRDLEVGPLREEARANEAYLRSLRLDFLRFHRRLQSQWNNDPDPSAQPSLVRAELAELAGRWRDHLLNRSATLRRGGWSPIALQRAIDQRVTGWQPAKAPVPPQAMLNQVGDSTWTRLARLWLRLRSRLGTIERDLPVADLGRYHFQGVVAGRMEGLAALLLNAEIDLLERTASLYQGIDHASTRLVEVSRTGSRERVAEAIEALRTELEQDFALAKQEAAWVVQGGRDRARTILATALRHFREDLATVDTPDLPARRRRFARVFGDRTAGLRAITSGLEDAREVTAHRFGALALAFEVVTLEARVKEAVDEHATNLARQIKGKGLKQLQRTGDALTRLRVTAEALLTAEDPETDLSGAELAKRLRDATSPAQHVVDEAAEAAEALRDWLASEASDEPLLDTILAAASELTERYEVPSRVPNAGEWVLPSAVQTTEIPFREVAVSFIEAHVTRELIDVTRRLALQIDGQVHVLQDLGRILSFNTDLAVSELEVHPRAIPEETRTLVQEMVLGSFGRGSLRLNEVTDEARGLPRQAREEVASTVLAQLEDFRTQVFDGRIVDLRSTVLREVQLQGRFLARAGGWRRLAREATGQIQEALTRTLGDDRITTIRHQLGMRHYTELADPEAFAPPVPLQRLPTVYRRLFSDQALEAGDLLTGREAEVQRAAKVLREHAGIFRTVALIGLDGIGKRAMGNALLRPLGVRTTRFNPTEPVTAEQIDELLSDNVGGAVLIDGIEHLFQAEPGGFEPLKHLIHGIALDQGRTAFVALFEPALWHFTNRMGHLESIFAEKISMRQLTADEIETALIARHNMSGYALEFEAGTDLAWHIADLLARDEDPHRRRQAAWFRTLHEASGGIMHDALRLWMASVIDVDENNGVLRIGPVQRPPVARIRRLPDDALLTLRAVKSQGSTTVEEHARQFQVTVKDAETHLAALLHAGLLECVEGRYHVARHLKAPIATVLEGRGWLA